MGSRGSLLFSMGILLFVAGYYEVRGFARRANAGWNLVPVVVVIRDMPAGTVLRTDDIAQQPLPSRFVSAGIVKPENYSYVVGNPLRDDLHKGDLLRWVDVRSPTR
jgi:Flp pilus assembly protein CpaB